MTCWNISYKGRYKYNSVTMNLKNLEGKKNNNANIFIITPIVYI